MLNHLMRILDTPLRFALQVLRIMRMEGKGFIVREVEMSTKQYKYNIQAHHCDAPALWPTP